MPDHFELAAEPSSAREARDLVRRAIAEAKWPGDAEAAVLLTSEVAANALRHAGSIGQLEVSVDDSRLRVEASDASRRCPEVCHPPPDAARGRGMAIVESVSSAWGVVRDGTGKTVWFELAGEQGGDCGP